MRQINLTPLIIVLFLSTFDNLQASHPLLFSSSRWVERATPPCGWSSPPGRAVVNGCCRDERTRDTPQSHLRALVSSAKPTTGIQVVRPTAPPMPQLAHKRCPQSRASPPLAITVRFDTQRQHWCAKQL